MEDKKPKIAVNIPPDYNGTPIAIEYREGETKALLDDKDLHIDYSRDVVIDAIPEWVKKRNYNSDPTQNAAVVEFCVNPKKPFINFFHDPENKEAMRLSAQLIRNADLEAWGINSGKQFSPKDLQKHILKHGGMFPDPALAKALISNLQNFQVRLSTEIKKADDRSGNTDQGITQALEFVKGTAPKQLQLSVALFNGKPKVDITLEIEIDVVNSQPVYSFYCFELDKLYEDKAIEYIAAVMSQLNTQFVCLEQQ